MSVIVSILVYVVALYLVGIGGHILCALTYPAARGRRSLWIALSPLWPVLMVGTFYAIGIEELRKREARPTPQEG